MSLIRGAEGSTLSLTLARARPAPGGQAGTHGQLCNTRMRGSTPEVFCKQSILIATRGLLLASIKYANGRELAFLLAGVKQLASDFYL